MFELLDVSLRFGPVSVLEGVDFRLAPGERVGITGPSGAGKSSLLNMAAGLLRPTSGRCINRFQRIALVFQDPRLLPWRRLRENIELPLRARGLDKREAARRAAFWLDRVGLAQASGRWPRELSGGMAQRANLARALALEPDCLLLDEPFSALDRALRDQLGDICREAAAGCGAALLCISHHPEELMRLTDRCIMIEHGGLRGAPAGMADSRQPRASRGHPPIFSMTIPT